MKKYLSLLKIQFLCGLQYRAAALSGLVTQFFWGVLEILLFRAFYQADSAAFPMEFSQLSTYIWLQQAFLALFMLWILDGEIFRSITGGNVAYELIRPADLYAMWFVKNAAARLARAALRCLPILFVAALLPAPYGLTLPDSPQAFLLFLLTMALALGVVTAFCMLIYISTFYTLNPQGVRLIAVSLTELLTGSVVPLPFLPDGIRAIIELTPFASMQNLPFRIYIGDIAGTEALLLTALQVFWLCALVALGYVWMRHALRRAVVQGG